MEGMQQTQAKAQPLHCGKIAFDNALPDCNCCDKCTQEHIRPNTTKLTSTLTSSLHAISRLFCCFDRQGPLLNEHVFFWGSWPMHRPVHGVVTHTVFQNNHQQMSHNDGMSSLSEKLVRASVIVTASALQQGSLLASVMKLLLCYQHVNRWLITTTTPERLFHLCNLSFPIPRCTCNQTTRKRLCYSLATMTVIGNLKRIARRPSTLLRGSKSNSISSGLVNCDTFSEDQGGSCDSDEDEFLDFPNLGRQHEPPSPPSPSPIIRKPTKYTPPPSAQELYVFGSKSTHEPRPSTTTSTSSMFAKPEQSCSRRASKGDVSGQFSFPPAPLQRHSISEQQAERIEAAKNRRRNSITTSNGNEVAVAVTTNLAQQSTLLSSNSPTSRRHSLTVGPDSQHPKTLYTIKPECVVTCSPMKKQSHSLRSTLARTLAEDSSRSIATFYSHESVHSAGSHISTSNGSIFSSTGWSVASNNNNNSNSINPESPRRYWSQSMHTNGNVASSLYMPTSHRYDSKRTLDSSFSTTGWSLYNDGDGSSVANSALLEEW